MIQLVAFKVLRCVKNTLQLKGGGREVEGGREGGRGGREGGRAEGGREGRP